jgi:AraC family transcriptional activator of pobA
LKNSQKDIKEFKISPMAQAGVLIIKMRAIERTEHDISQPHRDNHYLLMLAEKGQFKLNIDFEEVEFSAPTLLCVFPEQVHHILEARDRQGWVVSFDPSIIEEKLRQVLEAKFVAPMALSKGSKFHHQIHVLMELMEKLQSDVADFYTSKSIHSLLNALLNLIAGKVITITSSPKMLEHRGTIIKDAFIQLLKRHYKNWKKPSQYASELAISVSHLNDTVKGITGISISVHIQQVSILEAKRLLYFTDNSVKEIGYEVGYDEPVYFGKLFKKLTKLTPLEFRNRLHD